MKPLYGLAHKSQIYGLAHKKCTRPLDYVVANGYIRVIEAREIRR
jgi:hypothetical protein